VLPLLCGACLDLYVMMPFKRLIGPVLEGEAVVGEAGKVEMAMMQDWAFGIIHLKIAGRVIMYLDGQYARFMRQVFSLNPPPICSSFSQSRNPLGGQSLSVGHVPLSSVILGLRD